MKSNRELQEFFERRTEAMYREFQEGLTQKEIAQRHDVSMSRVKHLLTAYRRDHGLDVGRVSTKEKPKRPYKRKNKEPYKPKNEVNLWNCWP